jgi:hypothetical protein
VEARPGIEPTMSGNASPFICVSLIAFIASITK